MNVLDVFSSQGDRMELIPFAGVSRHKFRVPTSYNSKNFEIGTLRGADKILGGPVKALSPFFEDFRFFAIIFKYIKEPEKVPLLLEFHLYAYKGGYGGGVSGIFQGCNPIPLVT